MNRELIEASKSRKFWLLLNKQQFW